MYIPIAVELTVSSILEMLMLWFIDHYGTYLLQSSWLSRQSWTCWCSGSLTINNFTFVLTYRSRVDGLVNLGHVDALVRVHNRGAHGHLVQTHSSAVLPTYKKIFLRGLTGTQAWNLCGGLLPTKGNGIKNTVQTKKSTKMFFLYLG
jgi:hypothetical protein